MIKKENSTTTRSSSSKTLTNAIKIAKKTNTSSTTMNNVPVEVEPSNIQPNTINKFHIQQF
ncbi:hypothetical protein H8356DRAFT_1649179 [Neocallimastix lanati (nom. inval.)]|nr:hypothetical protein H8356DRAFT_1649179 [Neocallimastix sp. JGI-2020a]